MPGVDKPGTTQYCPICEARGNKTVSQPSWGDNPCWACGSIGAHPELGEHYWPCGTMKSAYLRGEQCYENEIKALRSLVREMGNLLNNIARNETWLVPSQNYEIPKIRPLLNRSVVREIMEKKS